MRIRHVFSDEYIDPDDPEETGIDAVVTTEDLLGWIADQERHFHNKLGEPSDYDHGYTTALYRLSIVLKDSK